jgi:hypothetical protein
MTAIREFTRPMWKGKDYALLREASGEMNIYRMHCIYGFYVYLLLSSGRRPRFSLHPLPKTVFRA